VCSYPCFGRLFCLLVLSVRSYIPIPIHYHALYLAFVGASGVFCVNSATFRYNGEAGSDGSQVLTSSVLQEWPRP
jgi:hypothetical protein